jgi:hypothetical protein
MLSCHTILPKSLSKFDLINEFSTSKINQIIFKLIFLRMIHRRAEIGLLIFINIYRKIDGL